MGLVLCEAPAAAQRQRSVSLQLRKLMLALTQVLKQINQQWYRGKAEVLMIGNAGEKRELWQSVRHQEELKVKRMSMLAGQGRKKS